MQGCTVLTHSYGELNCDLLNNYYNYFHLYNYSLLTSTHKPVLARAPSSYTNKAEQKLLSVSYYVPKKNRVGR